MTPIIQEFLSLSVVRRHSKVSLYFIIVQSIFRVLWNHLACIIVPLKPLLGDLGSVRMLTTAHEQAQLKQDCYFISLMRSLLQEYVKVGRKTLRN